MKALILINALFFLVLPHAHGMQCVDLLDNPPKVKDTPYHYQKFAEKHGFTKINLNPKYGWLKGLKITVPSFVQAKLKLKHKIELSEVTRAFEKWSEGPVEENDFYKAQSQSQQYQDVVRYYFVSKIKNNFHQTQVSDYIKVVIAITSTEEILLISAHRVSLHKYIDFIKSPKALD